MIVVLYEYIEYKFKFKSPYHFLTILKLPLQVYLHFNKIRLLTSFLFDRIFNEPALITGSFSAGFRLWGTAKYYRRITVHFIWNIVKYQCCKLLRNSFNKRTSIHVELLSCKSELVNNGLFLFQVFKWWINMIIE